MNVLKATHLDYALEGLRLAKAEKWLFTTKELRIIKKILDMQPLDKLEANRYSRTIKPKINAIIDFYSIARTTKGYLRHLLQTKIVISMASLGPEDVTNVLFAGLTIKAMDTMITRSAPRRSTRRGSVFCSI